MSSKFYLNTPTTVYPQPTTKASFGVLRAYSGQENSKYTAAKIICSTGDKIFVFDKPVTWLLEQSTLREDTPIAHFRNDEVGWRLACQMVDQLNEEI